MTSTSSEIAQNACDYARIEAAILYLEEHFRDQPRLDDVARNVGLSPHHFQRMFRRWAGISPKRFGQFLTLDYAKAQLEASASVLNAAYDAGLSGPSRLHDLFVTYEAMSPGAFKQGGDGVDISYGVHPSPFGSCFVGQTERGICALGFADDRSDASAVRAEFVRRWPAARFREDQAATEPVVARIFDGRQAAGAEPLRLALCGTNFQLKVWEALLRIPPGRITSYHALAQALGLPRSARAVGGAVAANPVSYLIPCHRVIRRSGRISNYEWGQSRKRVMLGWEAARFGSDDPDAGQDQALPA
ncbi:MAG: methylated-DNA--[protein]-cysteine S-methyltransferase [Rhodospirillales bacterium]|nr:methylated-DNA--[protein]-cysteine S-methyltransferase [Rhodospirillales bacterium]